MIAEQTSGQWPVAVNCQEKWMFYRQIPPKLEVPTISSWWLLLTPLKNMSSSVGIKLFPTEWKKTCSKPPIRYIRPIFLGLNFRGYTVDIWPKIWYFNVPPLIQPRTKPRLGPSWGRCSHGMMYGCYGVAVSTKASNQQNMSLKQWLIYTIIYIYYTIIHVYQYIRIYIY